MANIYIYMFPLCVILVLDTSHSSTYHETTLLEIKTLRLHLGNS